MLSSHRRIFHQLFLILPIFHTAHFACLAENIAAGLNGIRQTFVPDTRDRIALRKILVFVLAAAG